MSREFADEILAKGGMMFGATEFSSAVGIERRLKFTLIGSFLRQYIPIIAGQKAAEIGHDGIADAFAVQVAAFDMRGIGQRGE